MVYSSEEKLRMDTLLKVFSGFVANSRDVDIAYTEKTGYVRLIIAEAADSVFFTIQDFDAMLPMFLYDILCEEVSLAMSRNPDLTNRTMDYSIPHERLRAMLSTMDADREYVMGELDKFIELWKQKDFLP